jgi:hypothetical protein
VVWLPPAAAVAAAVAAAAVTGTTASTAVPTALWPLSSSLPAPLSPIAVQQAISENVIAVICQAEHMHTPLVQSLLPSASRGKADGAVAADTQLKVDSHLQATTAWQCHAALINANHQKGITAN